MISAKRLRFMSWNSNGLKTKIEKVKTEIQKQNCDVVFLQETHLGTGNIFENLRDYKSLYTTQTSTHGGVAVLIKKEIYEETSCTIERDPAGCYILVKCTLNGKLFTLVSVYNSQSNAQSLMTLISVLEENAEGILLIGGDFNVALNPFLDRTSTTNNNNHSLIRPVVEKLITSFHLVDVWRRLHPDEINYSYQQTAAAQTVRKSRLDYFFVPEESMQYIKKCEISLDKSCSDHYPVVLEIMFKEIKKLELFLIVFKEEETKDISSFQQSVADIWLSCKCKNIDLDPHKHQIISTNEVERAIRSLIVNDVKRPDGLPVSFYKSYSDALISYLCAFYNYMLAHPTNIPEAFFEATQVSETHYTFNVDYLIFSSIMAAWLHDHLQFRSKNYTDDKNGDDKKTMLLTFKRKLIEVKWSVLQNALDKEHRTEPPCRFRIAALPMMLKNSSNGKQKSLIWGCPLSQVMMTLYLKHVANEMIKKPGPSIHIFRENVIVRFSDQSDLHSFDTLKDKYTSVFCTDLEKSSPLCDWDKFLSLLEHEV